MKATVCILAYNHEAYIARAIEGALMQQTDFPYEIVVGEDDSSDKTRDIVKGLKERHPDRIRLLLNDRADVIYVRGRPTGRWNLVNTLQHARGEYVALCDGDDYWSDPRKLQEQVTVLERSPGVTLCFTNADILVEETGEIHPRAFTPPFRSSRFSLDDLLEHSNLVPTLTMLFRRAALPAYPEWYFRCNSGDAPLKIFCALRGEIAYIDESTAVYRQHGGGAWSKAAAHVNLERAVEDYTIFGAQLRLTGRPGFRKGISALALELARAYRREGDYRGMLDSWLRAIRWAPAAARARLVGAGLRMLVPAVACCIGAGGAGLP